MSQQLLNFKGISSCLHLGDKLSQEIYRIWLFPGPGQDSYSSVQATDSGSQSSGSNWVNCLPLFCAYILAHMSLKWEQVVPTRNLEVFHDRWSPGVDSSMLWIRMTMLQIDGRCLQTACITVLINAVLCILWICNNSSLLRKKRFALQKWVFHSIFINLYAMLLCTNMLLAQIIK